MKNDDAYTSAYKTAPRNADGSLAHEALVHLVAANIDFDAAKERLGKARRIVATRMKPGQTAPDGAVVFDGMEPYTYEPHRLLDDNEGNVLENKDARIRFKAAAATRAQGDAQRAMARLAREQRESNYFAVWTADELTKGRPAEEVTWDACVRETGLWKDADPDVESDPADEADEAA